MNILLVPSPARLVPSIKINKTLRSNDMGKPNNWRRQPSSFSVVHRKTFHFHKGWTQSRIEICFVFNTASEMRKKLRHEVFWLFIVTTRFNSHFTVAVCWPTRLQSILMEGTKHDVAWRRRWAPISSSKKTAARKIASLRDAAVGWRRCKKTFRLVLSPPRRIIVA